ncbi:MAG TPA: hypothetical protein VJV78_22175 [Polyangiales bacterium]|nr:hypothetical protein [Polyangiales bacterium]
MAGVVTTFHVYLGNPKALQYRWHDLAVAVRDILQPAFPKNSTRKLYVKSTMSAPTLKMGEVLVYVAPSQGQSILARSFDIGVAASRAGFTIVSDVDGAASEAYVAGTTSPGDLARVICHEILHNKTPLETNALHKRGGLSASPPGAPTVDDYRLLTRHLTAPGKQWLGGFRG